MLRGILVGIVCVCAFMACAPAKVVPATAKDVSINRIAEGVVLDGRLWVRSTMLSQEDWSGGLSSLALPDFTRTDHFDRGVFDIDASTGRLRVLRLAAEQGKAVVSEWDGACFEDISQIRLKEGELLIALVDTGTITVLSHLAIRTLVPAKRTWRVTPIKGALGWSVQTAVAAPRAGGAIYVGRNRGEWGGGLVRIDAKTGVVSDVERRETRRLCQGTLNGDCHPVTGVIPDPDESDCVLASVGLLHMATSIGRVLRVCGSRVTVAFDRMYSEPNPFKATEAFFGLAPTAGRAFWAVSSDTLYRFEGGAAQAYSVPSLEQVSGIWLSRDVPDAIVLGTDVNWAVSVSGFTPLVVPIGPSDGASRDPPTGARCRR